jgi:3-phosphoglycerate kinase
LARFALVIFGGLIKEYEKEIPMKITRKNLERMIKEETQKILSEYEDTTLRHGKDTAMARSGDAKEHGSKWGLTVKGHVEVLEEILARLDRIEGKIDASAGKAPMSRPS